MLSVVLRSLSHASRHRRCFSIAPLLDHSRCATAGHIVPINLSVAISKSRLFPNSSCGTLKLFSVTAASQFRKASDDFQEHEKEINERAERIRKNTSKFLIVLTGGAVLGFIWAFYTLGKPLIAEDGSVIEDEYSNRFILVRYMCRMWNNIIDFVDEIREPSRQKLLPDPLEAPQYQPPLTLVIELKGVLIHPEWTYETGWRFKKRSALDFFLQQVGFPNFELVIFTDESPASGNSIVDGMDPSRLVMYRLGRDATKYMQGHHVKDLSKLNRDLEKVIYLDWNPASFKLQPENALRLPKWTGDDEDTSLVDLALLLNAISESNPEDVRPILQHYSKFDDPIQVFKDNQKRLLEEQERQFSDVSQPMKPTSKYQGKLFGYYRHS